MNARFKENANMLLNEHIRDRYTNPLHIDGEERVRCYIRLKQKNELDKLIYRNGEINFTNEWVSKLIEEFISGHEGTWGYNTFENQVQVVNRLLADNALHLLFEEHYGGDASAYL